MSMQFKPKQKQIFCMAHIQKISAFFMTNRWTLCVKITLNSCSTIAVTLMQKWGILR